MMADLILKCAHCGKELLGDVYRIDQGSFGENPIGHFLTEYGRGGDGEEGGTASIV